MGTGDGRPALSSYRTAGEAELAALRLAAREDRRIFLHDSYQRVREIRRRATPGTR